MRFFIFLLLAVAHSAWGQSKQIIYFGGGGDPPGSHTIFDDSFSEFAGFSKDRGWDSTIYFDGGHKGSEKMAQQILGKAPPTFSSKNYDKQIEKTIDDLRSGKIKSGDQLMIVLDTHGDRQEQNLIHTVEAQDQAVSVDKMIQLKELAEAKGVKLAFLDTSCFGGNSMKLAGPNTCVISLSLPHRMANSEDTEALAKALENHKYANLEEAFLAGRKESSGDSQPQISSPQGMMVQNLLEELDKGLYDYDDLDTEISETNYCRNLNSSPDDLHRMAAKIKSFQRTMHTEAMQELSETERQHLKDLKVKIAAYMKARAPLDEFLSRDSTQQLCNKDKSYCLKLSEIDEQKKLNEDDLQENPRNKEDKEMLRDIARMQKNPLYLKWKETKQKLQPNADALEDMVTGISSDERALYNELYSRADKTVSGPNPCRDFKL